MDRVSRSLARLEDGLARIAGGAVLLMMGLITADASARYFFRAPLLGADTVTEMYLMVAVVFLALPRLQRTGGHIRVEFVRDRLPPRIVTLLDSLTLLTAGAVFALVTYKTGLAAWQSLREWRVIAGPVPWPRGPSLALVPLGTGLLTLRLLLQALTGALALVRQASEAASGRT